MTRRTTNRPMTLWTLVCVSAAAVVLLGIVGCEEPAGTWPPPVPNFGPTSQPEKGQQLFDRDDLAVDALVAAAKAKDHNRMGELFGPAAEFILGADVTMLCSTLLARGIDYIRTIETEMSHWMEEHWYESVHQLKGSLSQMRCPDPSTFERAQYMRALTTYKPA